VKPIKTAIALAAFLSGCNNYTLNPHERKVENRLETIIYVHAEGIRCNEAEVILEPDNYLIICDDDHFFSFNTSEFEGNYLRWGNVIYFDQTSDGLHDGIVDIISNKNRNGHWINANRENMRSKRMNPRRIDLAYNRHLEDLNNDIVQKSLWAEWLNRRYISSCP